MILDSIIKYSDQHGKELKGLIEASRDKLEEFKRNPNKIDQKEVDKVVIELRTQIMIYKAYTEELVKIIANATELASDLLNS